jgi:putative ABC transport system substrate-binding protein
MSYTEDNPDAPPRLAAFAQGLQELGWTDGGNIHIEYRHSGGDAERARKYAAELVALAPDVILAGNTSTVGLCSRRPVPCPSYLQVLLIRSPPVSSIA